MIQFYIKVFKMSNMTMICKNPAVKTETAGRLQSGSPIGTI